MNKNETALQLNIPSTKTIHKVGAKIIYIRAQNQENLRISIILSCCSNCEKLKTYAIYIGSKKGKILNINKKKK